MKLKIGKGRRGDSEKDRRVERIRAVSKDDGIGPGAAVDNQALADAGGRIDGEDVGRRPTTQRDAADGVVLDANIAAVRRQTD